MRKVLRAQSGQTSLMMLAVVGALLLGAPVLFAFGSALGSKGRHQRAADLAAGSGEGRAVLWRFPPANLQDLQRE